MSATPAALSRCAFPFGCADVWPSMTPLVHVQTMGRPDQDQRPDERDQDQRPDQRAE